MQLSRTESNRLFYTFSYFCSDGLVRVFTNTPDRSADPDVLQAFEEELAATSLSAQLELGGIKASE
jgi:hypothetical protein